MKTIYIKEIRNFLSSLIAYVVMGVFLAGTGMFLWIFPKMNVFENRYANLDTLFYIAPYMFMFLVSAVTMRSFSDEKKSGTIEILSTKPLSDWQIILGKYFASVTLVLFSLLPTLIYYYTIYHLASPSGNVDSAAIAGSYIGLFFLGSLFAAIGIFSSIITDNAIISFIFSMFLCFFFHVALNLLADFNLFGSFDQLIDWLSISFHYDSISRGVIDTRDVIYFLSMIILFLYSAKTIFGNRKY